MSRSIHNEYLDHRFEISGEVKRVVSLVSSATEYLGEMGLLDRVVGVSEYCDRYVDTSGMEVVGQYVTADIERIVQLEPDLLLMTTGIQRKLGLRMAKAGVPVYNLPLPVSFEGMLENVMLLGGLMDEMGKARQLVEWLRERAAKLRAEQIFEQRPRVYVELWLGRHMRAVGGLSYIRDLVEMAGGELVYGERSQGYFVPELDEVKRLNPDVYVFFHEPEYRVDGAALVRERGWDESIPVVMSDVTMGENVIQDGPSMLDTVVWLREQMRIAKRGGI
ncbi:vitamin B12-binding protein [Rubritalea halochordaticola]|uniref:Vitamin B12-binding protein n=1 Tax=Rubritalea halochordaticola TaxID=714537 RepID=A0ABP9UVZ1_9BACT